MTKAQVVAELFAATDYLMWWKRKPVNAWAIITRLHRWQAEPDVDPEHHKILKSMILAITGDYYNETKQPVLAADYYRQAGLISMKGGFAAIYADLVLRNQLTEHYAFALECLEAMQANFRSTSPAIKMLGYLNYRFLLNPSGWRLIVIEKHLVRSLRDRLA